MGRRHYINEHARRQAPPFFGTERQSVMHSDRILVQLVLVLGSAELAREHVWVDKSRTLSNRSATPGQTPILRGGHQVCLVTPLPVPYREDSSKLQETCIVCHEKPPVGMQHSHHLNTHHLANMRSLGPLPDDWQRQSTIVSTICCHVPGKRICPCMHPICWLQASTITSMIGGIKC